MGRKTQNLSSPFVVDEKQYDLVLPLKSSFRFIHEPLGATNNFRFVGRETEMGSLAERILFSEGGSFLVTGYRGVGKTSFINQVIHKLKDALPWANDFIGPTEIVDIYMNIARPLLPSELMHHIIRRIYERLKEKEVFEFLSLELQEAIVVAYNRTSLNMARKLSEANETSIGLGEVSLAGLGLKSPWSQKYSRTQNYEMSFLGYDDKSAEHDVIAITQKLARGYRKPASIWESLRAVFGQPKPTATRLKIIFIFDELDKLEEFTDHEGDSKPVIEEILGSLKNLFTTSGATFIFVAGKDLQERWVEDVGKGDSVYESVFSYDKYLPCLWLDGNNICSDLIDDSSAIGTYQSQLLEEFRKYLTFKGRGIPRRIVRTFNEHVKWRHEQPVAVFTPQNVRNIRFYAGLQDTLNSRESELFGDSVEEIPGTHTDKRRLGVYYLIDWILRQGESEFTHKDILSASKKLSIKIALAEKIAPQLVEKIIRTLIEGEYIYELRSPTARVVIGADQPIVMSEDRRYKISPRRLGEIQGIVDDVKIPDLNLSVVSSVSSVDADDQPTSIGRCKVLRQIARGGMGVVYEAVDQRNRKVAIKVLINDSGYPEYISRFRREAEILRSLDHPNIVKLYEVGDENGRPFIIMEYLDGNTLEDVIKLNGRLDMGLACAIVEPLAEAIAYVHQMGIVRNDIKPHNVLLTTEGRICLIDFGISKREFGGGGSSPFVTMESVMIGTPAFMAPEQINGQVDQRSDIYSFGVVLFNVLTANLPFPIKSPIDLLRQQFDELAVPSSIYPFLTPAADHILLKCLAHDPNERFQTMDEVISELKAMAAGYDDVNLETALSALGQEIRHAKQAEQMHTIVGYFGVEATGAEYRAAPVAMNAPEAAMPIAGRTYPDYSVTPQMEPVMPSMEFNRSALVKPASDYTVLHGTAYLRVTSYRQSRQEEVFPLKEKATMGRSVSNDIVIQDPSVSRYHAEIEKREDGWFISELNTFSGIYVNDERILYPYRLRNQDRIKIGQVDLMFIDLSEERDQGNGGVMELQSNDLSDSGDTLVKNRIA